MKVYKVVFTKYWGETKLFVAASSYKAMTLAVEWGKTNDYGTDIKSISYEGEVEAIEKA